MTELFSEVYNCYYQVIKSLIETKKCISEKELNEYIQDNCFEESILYLLPKLTENGWGFYKKQDNMLYSKFSADFYVPLTSLQKSYLKAILTDEKISLFLSDEEVAQINTFFAEVEPLYQSEDFYYYDRFADKDDYKNPTYREHFQTIMTAIQNCEVLNILYESRLNHRVHHKYLPCRLEYSIKNDCFRLLAVEASTQRNPRKGIRKDIRKNIRIEILNLSHIIKIIPTGERAKQAPDINGALKRSYDMEPVRIIIKNKRNALERAMLQFANYEKSTRKVDADIYECLIYYNKKTETELLIEILSFGPMIKVVGSESFLRLIKERLIMQQRIFQPTLSDSL